MRRMLAVALVTASMCFGVTAAVSWANGTGFSNGGTMKTGQFFHVPSVDLVCWVFTRSSSGDPGASLECERASIRAGSANRWVQMTRFHFSITKEDGFNTAYSAGRNP